MSARVRPVPKRRSPTSDRTLRMMLAYFVYAFLLPTVSDIPATSQHWFRDLRPWVDPNFDEGALFNSVLHSGLLR